MTITIKKLETNDEIKEKAYVHWRSWQETYPGLVEQHFLDELTLDRLEEIAYRYTENTFIAKDNEHVVGFVAYGNSRDENDQNTGEIYAIYISSDYYGKNVGQHLMQAALEQLSNYQQTIVWTLKANKRAINFYQKCGFSLDGSQRLLKLGAPVEEVRLSLLNQ